MITVKITAGSKSTVQGTGKWSYAWINNSGETAIYATTEWGTQTVTERIAEYEAGGAKDIVKLPAGSSKRLRANNRPVIIFGAEAGMAEVDLTNTDVSPFRVQAKGGDAKSEIIGGLTFDGLIDDEIIVDGIYEIRLVVAGNGETEIISSDHNGIVTIDFVDFGDGTTLENVNIPSYSSLTHTYSTSNDYNVVLREVKCNGEYIIGGRMFRDCASIETVRILDGAQSINILAFSNCENLTTVYIPKTVTNIGSNAFQSRKLQSIHFAGTVPPTLGSYAIGGWTYVIVPVGAVSAYEAAGYANVHEEGWQPPHDIPLTWETGSIDATTGADVTSSNTERSNITSDISEVLGVKWATEPYERATSYMLVAYCYNKSDGTYAGTYNGTSISKSKTYLHGMSDYTFPWNDDLSGLSQYDFRFVIEGRWGSSAVGQGQNVVVNGIE